MCFFQGPPGGTGPSGNDVSSAIILVYVLIVSVVTMLFFFAFVVAVAIVVLLTLFVAVHVFRGQTARTAARAMTVSQDPRG